MKQSNVKQYLKPESLEASVGLFKHAEGRAAVLASATDLFCADNLDLETIVDTIGLGLDTIRE